MNTPSQSDSKQRLEHILSTLSEYRMLWITPAVVGMILAAVYVVALRPQSWSAKQSLIVRDDLLGQAFKPGRFESIESMKSAQETILEMARKPQVIRNALKQLGPSSTGLFGRGNGDWPSEETIEDVQGSITFTAPNGAEFGKTEVIVLNTKASTRERSRKFIELLLNEIIVKVDEVRSIRLQSMEAELRQHHDAAVVALNESKSQLQAMDKLLGADGNFTLLIDSQSGDNTIKRDISQIRLEKRQTKMELEQLKTALSQLVAAKENPERTFTTSAALIKLLPALDDLKKGLIKTQGEFAVIRGKYKSLHPEYREAEGAFEAMKQTVHLEFDSSIAGIENDITLAESRLSRLNIELGNLDDRLINLSSNRADLMTLLADLKERTVNASNAKSDLSEIQGLSKAKNSDLITRVDEPQVSTRPDGLGKKATVLAVGLGGLMFGLGLVMLIAPPMESDDEIPASSTPEREHAHSTQNHNPDSFFESLSLDRIMTPATNAATAALQSAAKARQYFMSPKQRQTEDRDTLKPTSREVATTPAGLKPEAKPVEPDSVDTTDRLRQVTPAVNDLLAAAKSIAYPSPATAQSTESPHDVEVRTTETKQPKRKFTVRPNNPTAQPGAETPADEQPADTTPVKEELVSETPANNETAIETPIGQAATVKPASEIAAIQLAALQGTEVEPKTPAPAPPLAKMPDLANLDGVDNKSKVDAAIELAPEVREEPQTIVVSDLAKLADDNKSEVESTIELAPEVREEPQTIVVSELAARVSKQVDAEGSKGLPTSHPAADLTRRGPNVRPVDLAKSADADDSMFVRINPTEKETPDSEKVASEASGAQGENPFLQESSPKPTAESKSAENPMAVPDQIRKLSESIAKFANPKKPDERKD